MERKMTRSQWLRAAGVLLLAMFILAGTLPSTGFIYSERFAGGMLSPRLRRWGPFVIDPFPFLSVMGSIVLATGCTLFGIVRRNVCEAIGWIFLGLGALIIIIG
jgi:hypothetical protein